MIYRKIVDNIIIDRCMFNGLMPIDWPGFASWEEETEDPPPQIGWTQQVDGTFLAPPVPPPPTVEELLEMDTAEVEGTFTLPSILRAIVKDRFDVEKRLRVLEAKPTITLAQFKTSLAARIRGA